MSLPIVLEVKKIEQVAPYAKVYVFEHDLRAKPGQFVMVWMPGVDEIPMSIGWQTDKEFWLTIVNAGDCSKAIQDRIKEGDRMGIRGPYGNTFTYKGYKNVILVGGGCGASPLLNLAQATRAEGIKTTVMLGVRSADFVLYEDKFKKLGCELIIATNDGSRGHKGHITDLIEDIFKKDKIDCVYTCGPEMMMLSIAKMAKAYDIKSQVSLERYMKCGFGICGQCCVDDSGLRICKDGPVFDGDVALKHPELGQYKRASSGLIKPFESSKGCKR
jgi:dihydroorotate dehydrogenase electron transfer subunit